MWRPTDRTNGYQRWPGAQSKRSGPWVAIQLDVPVRAVGWGLACYYLLTIFSFSAVIAVILGLAIALLVRVAARSLLIEWLVARARQHAAPPGRTRAHQRLRERTPGNILIAIPLVCRLDLAINEMEHQPPLEPGPPQFP